MNVSLTPELEELVNEKVRSGLYQTASEVVRDALRLLKQRDQEARRADTKAGLTADDERRTAGRKPRGGTRKRVKR
jgi:antitoxin ParD1/3/4